MPNFRSPRTISLAVVVLLASGTVGYYLINQAGPSMPAAPSAQQVETKEEPGLSASENLEDNPAAQRSTAEPVDKDKSDARQAFREDYTARRMARFEAYNKVPAAERARLISQRWELTDEQERQIAEILAQFSKEWAELEKNAMSDADLARAQQSLQSRQIQAMTPILGDSPALQRSKQRFIDAGVARGGKLVRPGSE